MIAVAAVVHKRKRKLRPVPIPRIRIDVTTFEQLVAGEFGEVIRRSACYEIPSQDVDSISPENGKPEESTIDSQNQFRNAGRPRKYESAAARQRAYRERQSTSVRVGAA